MDRPRVDLAGKRVGRLTVEEFVGYRLVYKVRRGVWKCICDCGNSVEIEASRLDGKRTRSCGCLLDDFNFKHGMTGTKEHRTWCEVKKRTSNKTEYSHLYEGLEFYKEWEDDFMSFFEEIGECPTPKDKYSIDRIDTFKGYVPGNIRWARSKQQARNTSMHSNNKTGINGVCICMYKGIPHVMAYIPWLGNKKTKSFSLNKYAYEEALELAAAWRAMMEASIGDSDVNFSENHGKRRPSGVYPNLSI